MKNRTITIATLLFTAISCISCNKEMLLERNHIQDFHLEESPSHDEITISGLAMHSAYVVNRITTEKDKDNLIVNIHLTLTKHQKSGSFEFKLKLPNDISKVLIGSKRTIIWQRSELPTKVGPHPGKSKY